MHFDLTYGYICSRVDLRRSQSEEVRSAIGEASVEFAEVLNRLYAHWRPRPHRRARSCAQSAADTLMRPRRT